MILYADDRCLSRGYRDAAPYVRALLNALADACGAHHLRLGSAHGPDDADVELSFESLDDPGTDNSIRRTPVGATVPIRAGFIYDLVPLLHPDLLRGPGPAPEYARRAQHQRLLVHARYYDILFTFSDAVRRDVVEHLGVAPRRVVNISAGVDPVKFRTAGSPRDSVIFTLAADDRGSHLDLLLAAYTGLPEHIRAQWPLLAYTHKGSAPLQTVARHNDRHIRFVASVSDDGLLDLYRHAGLYVAGSRFGRLDLSVLEAAATGCPVLCPDIAAHRELLGDAAEYYLPSSATSARHVLHRLVQSPQTLAALARCGPERAARHAWYQAASRVWDALLRECNARRANLRVSRRTMPKSRTIIALCSPLPPAKTGIAKYVHGLARALSSKSEVVLFTEDGPGANSCPTNATLRSAGSLSTFRAHNPDVPIVYHIGNSSWHAFQYSRFLTTPDILELHDAHIGGLCAHIALAERKLSWLRELAANERAPQHLLSVARHPYAFAEAGRASGLTFASELVNRASRVIVHSATAATMLRRSYPDARIDVVPLGAAPAQARPERRAAVRRALGIPDDVLAIGVLGVPSRDKMIPEILSVAEDLDPSRIRILVGGFHYGEDLSRFGMTYLTRRIVVELGSIDDEQWDDVIQACDVGLCLRRPPTTGETSAVLNQWLAASRPVVVVATGSFSELPDGSVIKLDPRGHLREELRLTLQQLVASSRLRVSVAEEGARYIARLSFDVIADQYRRLFEDGRQ